MTNELKLKSALNKAKLRDFITKSEIRTIAVINHNIQTTLWYWVGSPTSEIIKHIESTFPQLTSFIDFQIVESRLNDLELFKGKKEDEVDKYFGIPLSKFFPELVEVKQHFSNLLSELPKGIKKAELWLYPIALNAGADAEMEAAIYFASRGEPLLDALEIKAEWHRVICLDIEKGVPVGKLPDEVLNRAKSKTIPLSEASEILTFNGHTFRFFKFRDEEEDFIDATFFRAVEWYGVKGFEPWLESIARDVSITSQDGIDQIQSAWYLFYWCRSDLGIKKTNKFGLESFLYGLINGSLEQDKPWRTAWPSKTGFDKVDYIPTASIILFAWHRIKPTNLDPSILERAVQILFQTQLNSGGWPVKSNDSEGSILSTCLAIHALAITKPEGGREVAKKAKEWLLQEQEEGGYWMIEGGPTVMLTVLALESIHLVMEDQEVSFSHEGKKVKKEITPMEQEIDDPTFDYSKEEWFKSPIPKSTSISKDEAIKLFNPIVALVTAVEVELIAVLKRLKPPKGKRKVWRVFDGAETYYLGRFGEFDTVVTMSGMGSQGISGSTLTIESLIRLWNPTGIVLVGIAFGANKKKQKAGDVLIANHIIPYEQQRVGEELIYRNPIAPSSHELINRIKNTLDWNFQRPDKSNVEKHIGNVLSGEKLVDDLSFKNGLITQFPQVIGGEMEGSGLWAAASRHKKSWILIKSVCDWGDGKKHKDYQQLAAASAVSLCEHIFSDKYSLDGMK